MGNLSQQITVLAQPIRFQPLALHLAPQVPQIIWIQGSELQFAQLVLHLMMKQFVRIACITPEPLEVK